MLQWLSLIWSKRQRHLPLIYSLVGILAASAIISYSYKYAALHDPTIKNFFHYLIQKQYRFLQFTVTLLPIPLGFFFGRLQEELAATRAREKLLRFLLSQQQINYNLASKLNHSSIPFNFNLSPRETEILKLVVSGMSNKEIAAKLVISDKTVKTHLQHIFSKLEVSDRTSAAVAALREGLVK